VRLSPHTAQHLWSVSMDIHEASVPISPAPRCIPRGQLARSLGTFVPIFPKARGLCHQSSSWCTWLSHARTTMPHPTFPVASGFRWGLPCLLSTPLCIHQEISRVPHEGLQRHAGGGVLLNTPSPLWGSPIFLQGRVRLTWSPITDHPGQSLLVPPWLITHIAGSTG
jgi:hypothetical protein